MEATLAPRFTRENAADYARRAVISRENNRAKLKAGYAASKAEQLHVESAADEVLRVLRSMKRVKPTDDNYATLAAILDRLWNKAFPTQGAVKSGRTRPSAPSIEPISPVETPQGNLREIKHSAEKEQYFNPYE